MAFLAILTCLLPQKAVALNELLEALPSYSQTQLPYQSASTYDSDNRLQQTTAHYRYTSYNPISKVFKIPHP